MSGSRSVQPHDLTPPRAAAMIESLRAFGYDLQTAIADLIDNSISAGSKNVWIDFEWAGARSKITIADDGGGMTEDELKLAMTPGSRSPIEERAPRDLGRFGLGLKTASFSQCRRLTVVSKSKRGALCVRCWDLDHVVAAGDWQLLKSPELATPSLRKRVEASESGTLVHWEKLDRVVGNADTDDQPAHRRWSETLDQVKHHLAMVFHRFLTGPTRIKLWFNDRVVEAWDPFLSNEAATQALGHEVLQFRGGVIEVQPYVLPHHSKVTSEVQGAGAGPNGWVAQQGFYVYRGRRLLVAGDWLGLGFQKDEHFKLARIQLDIPNTMDSEWEIDVKKSRAKPPGALQTDLRRIAAATRIRASEIFRHRGKLLARETADSQVFVWLKKVRRGKIFYEINRKHPLVEQILMLNKGNAPHVHSFFRLVEETIPVPTIVISNAETPDGHGAPFEESPSRELVELVEQILQALLRQGLTVREAGQRIGAMEPFNRYQDLVYATVGSHGG